MPAVSSFAASGMASTLLIEACSLLTISRGVPAGATMPARCEVVAGKGLRDGGNIRRKRQTLRAHQAEDFTFLSRQSGSDTLMLSMPKAMSPARMPVICVVPPR